MQIRKQFRETCKTQTKQYKRYKAQILQTTPKEQQKEVIKQLKEEKHRKLTLLGEQVNQIGRYTKASPTFNIIPFANTV